MIGILYLLAYQILGMLIAMMLLKRERICFTILLGSVIGSVSLQWLPIICSFFLNFTKASHIAALVIMLIVAALVAWFTKGTPIINKNKFRFQPKQLLIDHPVLFLLVPLYIYVIYVLQTHTLPLVDGAMHTGQCTYGDMNMHLGFITSIANQGTFPPEYSILPGTQLAYPFLSDSISSSVYVWGTSLTTSYLLPMYVALLQVFFGMYTLATEILEKKGKAFLAFTLFFLNGGFGFYYFITDGLNSPNFTRIFTEFYQTPTNLVDKNIRFTNIIVDMLIPQRATLFGFAVLFPLLALLWKAKSDLTNRKYFILAGIIAGALPMIHTHSFMALGLLCVGWLLLEVMERARKKPMSDKPNYVLRIVITTAILCFMSVLTSFQHSEFNKFDDKTIFAIGICGIILLLAALLYFLVKGWNKDLLHTWGIFLVFVLVLALPQLFYWTFRQASGDGFIRGGLGWSNEYNSYMMFYLKNLGITFILLLVGVIVAPWKKLKIVLPAFIIWLLAEFILFQPNPYDNNKLLLVGFLLICIFTADVAMELIGKCKQPATRVVLLAGVIFFGTFAGILTMGREAVSDYELYSKDYVDAAAYVEEHTEPTDTFLTATNHNNAIASLTGRNIVCGSGSFLYYHGLDYGQAESAVSAMYQDSSMRDALLKQYNVKYILIGPSEIGTYQINDTSAFDSSYEKVYEQGMVKIYKVK